MDVPQISKCKEISRYLQKAWFRCETAYISGFPNWANKSAQTHWEAVTKTRRGRGNCIRTRAIVVTFCQGLSGSGSVVGSYVFLFLGAEFGWIPRCFFHGIRLFFCRPSCQISGRDFRNVDFSKQKNMEDSWSRMRWCDDPDGVLESWEGGFTLLDPRIWVVLPPSNSGKWSWRAGRWCLMWHLCP